MRERGFQCLAYVDDFCGVESSHAKAIQAYQCFHHLCNELGLVIAPEKSSDPSVEMEWLGYMINSQSMTVVIPKEKINEVVAKTNQWIDKIYATRRDLQCLVGRLAHISSCIRHARKFLTRLLYQLRNTPTGQKRRISDAAQRDIAWFRQCAASLNCRRLIIVKKPEVVIECDACPQGGGGFSRDKYYSVRFPHEWAECHHISRLVALNVIIAIVCLVPNISHANSLLMRTDNSATAAVLLNGRTQDVVMGACARELANFAIRKQIDIDIVHVPGELLVLADALSRSNHDAKMNNKASEPLTDMRLEKVTVDVRMLNCDFRTPWNTTVRASDGERWTRFCAGNSPE